MFVLGRKDQELEKIYIYTTAYESQMTCRGGSVGGSDPEVASGSICYLSRVLPLTSFKASEETCCVCLLTVSSS